MAKKGFLERINDGIWKVKWSDLHSFAHGTHWSYSDISPESNTIRYVDNNRIMYLPFVHGLAVEFEFYTSYDVVNFTPIHIAKLVFPEVEKFEKEENIKKYIRDGGNIFTITNIDTLRDGGTNVLVKSNNGDRIFVHKDNWTLHHSYPTTDNSLITDKPTKVFIMDKLENYLKHCEENLQRTRSIIKNIKP